MLSLFAVLLLTALGCMSVALITWLVANRDALAHAWWRRRHPHPVPLTIMVADPRQGRNVERALDTALRQLGHAHGLVCPASRILYRADEEGSNQAEESHDSVIKRMPHPEEWTPSGELIFRTVWNHLSPEIRG